MLEILPENGLDRSILLPVLVGLGFTTLFTETLGWTFVALVVPGYLSAVFIAAPISGVVMVAEAVLTYLITRLVGVWLPQRGGWLVFFGRERFYLIIVVSIFVRILTEGFGLPAAARFFEFRHASDLFSIGLVIVPLAANAFWNVGLPRGFRRTGTITLLTWLVVAFLLTPFINLNLNYFEYTYESVALDFFSSPKAYLIILVGAIVGARTNHLFGWDYNGILVPGLLALAWYSPLKLASTLAEAVFVAWLAQQLVLLPPLNRVLMEGPRRTFYVFCVGFTSKFMLGHLLGTMVPGMSATDLYGFGYVLPSLVAVKIWQKRNAPRILVPAVGASLAAFIFANMAGYSLHVLMPGLPRVEAESIADNPADEATGEAAEDALAWALVRATAWPLRSVAGQGAAPNLAWVQWLAGRATPTAPLDETGRMELETLRLRAREFVLADGSRWTLVQGSGGTSVAAPAFLLSHSDDAEGVVVHESHPCGPQAVEALGLARSSQAAVVALVRSGQWSQAWQAALESSLGRPPRDGVSEPHVSSWFAGASTTGDGDEDAHVTLDAMIEAQRAAWPTRSHVRRTPVAHDALRCFSSQLVPWLARSSGESHARQNEAHVSAVAGRLGFRLLRNESLAALVGKGPGDLLWIRRMDGGPNDEGLEEVVVVPFPEMGVGTLEAARGLFEERRARDFLIGGHAGGYQPDASDAGGARSHLQRAVELLLARKDRRILVVRPLPAHHELPGVDIVMTNGILGDWPDDSWLGALQKSLQRHGTVQMVDGRSSLFPLRGTGDSMLSFARHLAPGRVTLLWWASRPRARLLSQQTPSHPSRPPAELP